MMRRLTKKENRVLLGLLLLQLICTVVMLKLLITDIFFPPQCVESVKVTSIVALNAGGGASIELADGTQRNVGNVALKPGDNYCLRYEG